MKIEDVAKQLSSFYKLEKHDNVIIIYTPFLDNFSDEIRLYLLKTNHGYCLDDDGFIIDNLEPELINAKKFTSKYWRTLRRYNCYVTQNKNDFISLNYEFASLHTLNFALAQMIQCIVELGALYDN